jgi:hypothetical protein
MRFLILFIQNFFSNPTSFHLELSSNLPSLFLVVNMASDTDNDSSVTPDSPSLEQGEGVRNVKDAIPEAHAEELSEAPEGSLKAYLVLIGAFTAMFVSFGWVNCIALFQAEYETNQLKQYISSQISWITSIECKISLQSKIWYTKWPVSFLYALHFSPRGENV